MPAAQTDWDYKRKRGVEGKGAFSFLPRIHTHRDLPLMVSTLFSWMTTVVVLEGD